MLLLRSENQCVTRTRRVHKREYRGRILRERFCSSQASAARLTAGHFADMTRFDFNPRTNVPLRRFLLVIAIVVAAVAYPIGVIEAAIAFGDGQSFGYILISGAFLGAFLPLGLAMIIRRSFRPLRKIYQPVAVAALPMVVLPMETVLVLAVAGVWLYAHWLFGELELWGTMPEKDPKEPKPEKAPMKDYSEDAEGNIVDRSSGPTAASAKKAARS